MESKKILIVDDDRDSIPIIEAVLPQDEYIGTSPPHKMDFERAKEVKNESERSKTPVFMLFSRDISIFTRPDGKSKAFELRKSPVFKELYKTGKRDPYGKSRKRLFV